MIKKEDKIIFFDIILLEVIKLQIRKIEIKNIISIIKEASLDKKKFHPFIIEDNSNVILFGEMANGILINPLELTVVNKESLCQELYDAINNSLNEEIIPGNIVDIEGNLEYYLEIGENVVVTFPKGELYNPWIKNLINKKLKQR